MGGLLGRFGAVPLPDFDSFFSFGQKDGVLNDMIATVRGLLSTGNNRKQYAQSWWELGRSIQTLIVSQDPERKDEANQIVECFQQIAKLEVKLADAEIRNADDFRDIVERYDILFRCNEEWLKARAAQQGASNELEAASRTLKAAESKSGGVDVRKVARLEQEVTRARAMKSHALDKSRMALEKLIEVRNAYTKLKVRRLRHGWMLYGKTLKEVCEEEGTVLRQVKALGAKLKGGFGAAGGQDATDAVEMLGVSAPEPAVADVDTLAVVQDDAAIAATRDDAPVAVDAEQVIEAGCFVAQEEAPSLRAASVEPAPAGSGVGTSAYDRMLLVDE